MKAYCVKCKEKREMNSPEAVYTANGTPGTRGACVVCGTKMFKMGRTPALEHIPAPDLAKTRRKKGSSPKSNGGQDGRFFNLVVGFRSPCRVLEPSPSIRPAGYSGYTDLPCP